MGQAFPQKNGSDAGGDMFDYANKMNCILHSTNTLYKNIE